MTPPTTHPREEEAAAFVFGFMEDAERETFARDLEADAVLKQVVAELSEAASAITLSTAQIAPPPALKSQVLNSVKSLPQDKPAKRPAVSATPAKRSGGSGLIGWAAAAAFAVLCGVLWDKANTTEQSLAEARKAATAAASQLAAARNDGEAAKAQLAQVTKANEELKVSSAKVTEAAGVLEGKIAALSKANKVKDEENALILKSRDEEIKSHELANMQIASLKSTIADYKQGVAVVVWDSAKQEGVLKLEKMPLVDLTKDYQLWVVDPSHKTPVNAGVVRVDKKGFAKVQFKPNFAIQQADKFALSVEKKVDDPAGVPENKGPIVLLSQ